MSEAVPEGWKLAPLSSLARVVSGGTPSRDVNFYWGGDIPWVTPTDISRTNGRYLFETQENITRLGLSSSAAALLPPGSILMTSRATVGESRISEIEVCTNQGFKSLVPQKGVNGLFLYYQMQRLRDAYKVFGIGSTFLEVSKKDTERFNVLMPVNEGEQQAIAAAIDSVDIAIEKTEALIAKYQQIKAGLMHDLFTRGVTADDKLRPPREQAPELYQETPMGWIPKEWDVQRVGDIFDIQLGKMLNKLARTGKGVAPYLGNRAVQWDFVDCSAIEEMDFSSSEREKFSLVPGDLLVCEGGDVGRTAMWRGELESCYFQKAIHRLRPKSDRALPAFMLRFMRFAKEVGYFREFTSQSSIAHLTQEKLGAIPMLLPKPNEQKWIAERFDVIDKLIQGEQSNLYKLGQQKLGLMSDLLTGKVRVKGN